MQATIFLALAIVAVVIIGVAVSLAWFIVVPIVALLIAVAVAYGIAFASSGGRRAGAPPAGSGESHRVPSSGEASYNPVSDPSKPGTTPR